MIYAIIIFLIYIWAAYNYVNSRPFCKKKIIRRGNNEAYLVRYSFLWLSCKWWAVKVHHILLSDDACPHSHPWAFISIMLWGGYLEHRLTKEPNYNLSEPPFKEIKTQHSYSFGSILWRPKNTIHRLELVKPCWTLVVTFRKVQDWGFYTPKGFVQHEQYNEDGGCE